LSAVLLARRCYGGLEGLTLLFINRFGTNAPFREFSAQFQFLVKIPNQSSGNSSLISLEFGIPTSFDPKKGNWRFLFGIFHLFQ
jgi:hypothetical protein